MRVTALMVRGLLGLPDAVLRGIGGPAVTIDGATLSPTAQLVARLERLVPRSAPHTVDLTVAREHFDIASAALLAGVARDVRAYDTIVDGEVGPLTARVYAPARDNGGLLVFLHGGGFVLGSLTSHDGVCRFLSKHAGMRVVAVEYRLAPEHPYPAAVNDAMAAFRQIASDAVRFGGSGRIVGIGGDSAGATIAAAVSQRCADEGTTKPSFTVLLCPALDGVGGHSTRQTFGRGYFVDNDTIKWYQSCYVPDLEKLTDPYVSPLYAKDVSGLPPTCVVTGGFDPFWGEGVEYVAKLRAAGVRVTHLHHPGLVHGFPGFVACDRHARTAMHEVVAQLRRFDCGVSVP
ncbi:hypothetical protein ALI144C_16890 [Actinosynnema sp. ALI-1.44]|nr:hypothetical protein ALI144C_16890 [Actinosynnema sp. ALI-1.44]